MAKIIRRQFLAGAAASVAVPTIVRAQTPAPKLRVGCSTADQYGEPWYALDAGFFQKAGLDVEMQNFQQGAMAASAVVGGSLDIGGTTPLLLANAIQRSVPLVIIVASAFSTPKSPASLVCVAANGPLRSAKDLVGKTVGVNELHTVLELSLDAWLDKNGVDRSSVKRVEVVFSQMAPAIERGAIDAAIIVDPFKAAAVQAGTLRSIADPNVDIAPRFVLGAFFTSRNFAQQNDAVIRRFVATIYETGKWANEHRQLTAPILAKYSKLSPDVIRTMARCEFAEQMNLKEMQVLLDASVKYGYLPRPMNAADLVLQ